jgi:hypothetical protein
MNSDDDLDMCSPADEAAIEEIVSKAGAPDAGPQEFLNFMSWVADDFSARGVVSYEKVTELMLAIAISRYKSIGRADASVVQAVKAICEQVKFVGSTYNGKEPN